MNFQALFNTDSYLWEASKYEGMCLQIIDGHFVDMKTRDVMARFAGDAEAVACLRDAGWAQTGETTWQASGAK